MSIDFKKLLQATLANLVCVCAVLCVIGAVWVIGYYVASFFGPIVFGVVFFTLVSTALIVVIYKDM